MNQEVDISPDLKQITIFNELFDNRNDFIPGVYLSAFSSDLPHMPC